MLQIMRKNWWMFVVRGIIAIFFGLSIIASPGIALTVLVLLWGAYALADGITAVIAGGRGRRWFLLLEGLISVGAGVLTFVMPAITAIILLYIIAFRAIMTGILEIMSAFQLRKKITGELWLGLSGIVSVIFGGLLITSPDAGILSLLWVLAFYGISFGVMMIVLGFRIRKMPDDEGQLPFSGGMMQQSLARK